MDFMRARSEEQKNIRIEQICGAALELFDTEPYDKITLVSIAEKLDFSRANIYKYFHSKEEIYLILTMDEMNDFFQDILQTFQNVSTINIEEFARIWSKILFQHERLLKLCSILFGIIEKNATVQCLAEFKKQLFVSIENLYPTLKRLLPGLSESSILTFLDYQLHHIAGLYPDITLNEAQLKAIQMSGIPYEPKNFTDSFSDFLTTMLLGLYQRH